MDNKNDEYWFNEILRIEREEPIEQRSPDNKKDISFSNSFTEERIDDYFAIEDRFEYLRFIRSRKNELSESSYLWLIEDIPNYVIENYRVTLEDLEELEKRSFENV